eukprot:753410-Hanusia_phi.AAC.2
MACARLVGAVGWRRGRQESISNSSPPPSLCRHHRRPLAMYHIAGINGYNGTRNITPERAR